MAWPSLTWGNLLPSAVRQEWEQFTALLQGYLSTQHRDDGTHLHITAESIVVGDATGGNTGVGTINVAGDVYKNNTAYTNPDYVFEHWHTGTLDLKNKFATTPGAKKYKGLLPLTALEAHVRTHFRFPQIAREPLGMFARADVTLELLEQVHLYLFEHQRQIAKLEAQVKKMEGR